MVNPTTKTNQSGADAIGDVIARVMDRFDTNADGQLSNTEFTQFLSGLLSGADLTNTPAAGAAATTPLGSGAYRSMLAGFDATKIDHPAMPGAGTSKYRAARVFQDYPPSRDSLPSVIARLQAQGIDARQTDHDKIDFGDGCGPVDVIAGSRPGGGDAWQWHPVGGGSLAASAASSWEEGYASVQALDPNMPRETMEATLAAVFGSLPGYGGVYKEAVMRNGDWIDLVGGYGGADARWQVLNKSEAETRHA